MKDFTFLDFIFMVPRLHVLLRSKIKFSGASDPKARASGYAHTYFDSSSIRLDVLPRFPSDEDIQGAAKHAWTEAESLVAFLGIRASEVVDPTSAPVATASFPGISSWFTPGSDLVYSESGSSLIPPVPQPFFNSTDQDEWFSEDSDEGSEYGSEDSFDEASTLQDAIEWCEKSGILTASEKVMNLACTAAALSMDDSVRV